MRCSPPLFIWLAPHTLSGTSRRDVYERILSATDGNQRAILAKLRKYYTLTPLFAFCMYLVAVANNLGVMWVAVEGTTLASIFLVTFYGRPTSLEAAWKYAIIGGVGLSMALFGTVLTYYSAHQVLGSDSLSALNWSVLVGKAAHFDKPRCAWRSFWFCWATAPRPGWRPCTPGSRMRTAKRRCPWPRCMATALLNCALYALARFYVLTSRCLGPAFASIC